jgi:thiamine biosynthesis lipoprotein
MSFHDATGGLYHPALGTLVSAFDLRGEGRWPSDDDLQIAMAHARRATIQFNRDEKKLILADPELRLDLDGIAKGWALDRSADVLRRSGVETALLNFGGQVLAMGPSSGCPAFPIQIATPDSKETPTYELLLRNGSVSTTSNASRSRSVSGKVMGHILDPRTGGFASFEGSVTVRARTGAAADALSTALFVCGPELSQACLSAGVLRDEEVEAVFLVPDGKGSYFPRKAGAHAPDPSARATPGPGN